MLSDLSLKNIARRVMQTMYVRRHYSWLQQILISHKFDMEFMLYIMRSTNETTYLLKRIGLPACCCAFSFFIFLERRSTKRNLLNPSKRFSVESAYFVGRISVGVRQYS